MNNTTLQIPLPENEPVLSYAPGSPERKRLFDKIQELKKTPLDIPAFIGGKEIRTGNTEQVSPPHDHQFSLGQVHNCGAEEVALAIQASMKARAGWMNMPWTDRAAIFLRAAELLAGPWRDTINAATMLGQSKNPHQAEIDSACELIDFLRFNVHYMEQIYSEQPYSPARHLESTPIPTAGRICFSRYPLQLHSNSGESLFCTCHDGQRGFMEAFNNRCLLRLLYIQAF